MRKKTQILGVCICFSLLTLPLFAQKYIVVGWHETGIHEFRQDFSNFALNPPHNVLRAQVIRVGEKTGLPEIVTSGIKVIYEIPGNTYSAGKTNFWEYADKLYGVNSPPDNLGLTGLGLSGEMILKDNCYIAQGIPLTPYQDGDLQNADPYQLAYIRVYDLNDNLLTETRPVIPVSNEINCVSSGCHSSEQDILNRHEEEDGFDPNNKPILCVSCHASNLAGTSGTPGLESFSEVIHDRHVGRTNNCYNCHAGPQAEFNRGIMFSSGLDCVHCHGNVRQVANSIRDGREPWLEEPGCADAGCHASEYAPEPGKLFKDSEGHAGVACSFCHGSPHAEYPSTLAQDNAQMIALQGKAGVLTDCQVCHGERLAPGPGPHGILPDLASFETSLHATRRGKAYWYEKKNGGFESLTNVPMDSLACQKCHGAAKADGTAIDDATYQPDCYDCHDRKQWLPVGQETCLGCHSRQKTEIDLAGSPAAADHFSDVHRDAGMRCTDCHQLEELHGDGQTYNSIFEPGAIKAGCTNSGCHPTEELPQNVYHDLHLETTDCAACHVQSVISCTSCHFETETAQDKKRFYGPPPMHDFIMLVNSEKTGKITTATFQALTYRDTTFYAIAPYTAHTVKRKVRECMDCHRNEHVKAYFADGKITVTRWDDTDKKIVGATGAVPVPPEWQTALQFDFVTYTGAATDPIDQPFDPARWSYLKTGADGTQMLFAKPLTIEQMNLLDFRFPSSVPEISTVPKEFSLAQNYPNPFNPLTTIVVTLPETAPVRLTIHTIQGEQVDVLVAEDLKAGTHRYVFDGRGIASGIYIYRIEAGAHRQSRKMVLLK